MTRSYTLHQIAVDLAKGLDTNNLYRLSSMLMFKMKSIEIDKDRSIKFEWKADRIIVTGALCKTYPISEVFQVFGFSPKLGHIEKYNNHAELLHDERTEKLILELVEFNFKNGLTQETMADALNKLIDCPVVDLGGFIISTHLTDKLHIAISSPKETHVFPVTKTLLEIIINGGMEGALTMVVTARHTSEVIGGFMRLR